MLAPKNVPTDGICPPVLIISVWATGNVSQTVAHLVANLLDHWIVLRCVGGSQVQQEDINETNQIVSDNPMSQNMVQFAVPLSICIWHFGPHSCLQWTNFIAGLNLEQCVGLQWVQQRDHKTMSLLQCHGDVPSGATIMTHTLAGYAMRGRLQSV